MSLASSRDDVLLFSTFPSITMAKKTLKAALTSHQGRMKKNAKAQEAAQAKEKVDKVKTSSKAKGKAKALPPRTQKSVVPFSTTDKILLIGEGNFSFSLALFKHPALEFLPGESVTATAYDSEEECYEKYPDAKEIVQHLRDHKAEVLFRVDATKLESCKALKGRRWNKVVWNFPHAGEFTRLLYCFDQSITLWSLSGPR